MSSTYKKLQLYVRWNGMKEDVEGCIKKCDKCRKEISITHNNAVNCHSHSISNSYLRNALLILLVPLLRGYWFVLTIQDDSSKYLIAIPLKEQTTEEFGNAFVENPILIYGLPQVVLSDLSCEVFD